MTERRADDIGTRIQGGVSKYNPGQNVTAAQGRAALPGIPAAGRNKLFCRSAARTAEQIPFFNSLHEIQSACAAVRAGSSTRGLHRQWI